LNSFLRRWAFSQLLTRFHFADGRVELRLEPVADDQNKRRQ
jgi:hypothetical protein